MENNVLIYLPEEWRRLHNEELCALLSSLNTIRVVKSRKIRWVAYGARVGKIRSADKISVGENPRETDHLKNPGVDKNSIKMDIKKSVMGARSGLIWLRICLSTSFYDTDILIDFLLVVIN